MYVKAEIKCPYCKKDNNFEIMSPITVDDDSGVLKESIDYGPKSVLVKPCRFCKKEFAFNFTAKMVIEVKTSKIELE